MPGALRGIPGIQDSGTRHNAARAKVTHSTKPANAKKCELHTKNKDIMAQEIERKFLVKENSFRDEAIKQTRIVQGYLSSVPERTVRVRIKGEKGFLTIKGIGSKSGASRYEWEKEISVKDAEELLEICEPGVIEKVRYIVQNGKHDYEVDEFFGENEGLIIAEVELSSEDEAFNKPAWLGQEVTGYTKYYNSMLMKKPYRSW